MIMNLVVSLECGRRDYYRDRESYKIVEFWIMEEFSLVNKL